MDIHPRLIAEAQFEGQDGPGAYFTLFTWQDAHLAVVQNETEAAVYDLGDVVAGRGADHVAGRVEPRLRVDAPELARRGVVAPSPNADFVVHCGRRELCLIDAGGVRWRFPHVCWGCADETDHSDKYTCTDSYSGSAYVSADGRVIFAHTPSPWDEETDGGEQWVVLDAADGTVLAARPLASSAAAGSGHHLSPNGRNLALDIGYGQDGSTVFLGEWDGTDWTVTETEGDRISADFAADGRSWLSTPHDMDMDVLVVHEIPGGRRLLELPSKALPFATSPEYSRWDFPAAFLDAETIIATVERDGRDGTEHWLIDIADGPIGPVGYDIRYSSVTPLGDGRWATDGEVDGRSGNTLQIWKR